MSGQSALSFACRFTHYAAFALFGFFGGQLVYKAYHMDHDGVSEELEAVEEELENKDSDSTGRGWRTLINPIYLQAFTMTALAEWGDRSQVCYHVSPLSATLFAECRTAATACFSTGLHRGMLVFSITSGGWNIPGRGNNV